MDPMLTYVTARAVTVPENEHAEYAVAGAWLGEPVEVVSARRTTCSCRPGRRSSSRARCSPAERAAEGPWGENADIYAASECALIVKCELHHHRKDPINYGMIVGRSWTTPSS